ATSAVREAKNKQYFIDRVRNEVGLRVRVLSGDEEARLAFESAASSFDLSETQSAVLDVGGGSLELILAVGNNIKNILSLPLGASRKEKIFWAWLPIAPTSSSPALSPFWRSCSF